MYFGELSILKLRLAAGGSLIIEAYTRNEKLTLKTTSTKAQTYFLGTSTSKTATYVLSDADGGELLIQLDLVSVMVKL